MCKKNWVDFRPFETYNFCFYLFVVICCYLLFLKSICTNLKCQEKSMLKWSALFLSFKKYVHASKQLQSEWLKAHFTFRVCLDETCLKIDGYLLFIKIRNYALEPLVNIFEHFTWTRSLVNLTTANSLF
jgi:hypothetical protein